MKYECCPYFGDGEEINDYGHCWSNKGENCSQQCKGLDKDGNVCEWIKNNDVIEKEINNKHKKQ